MNPAAHAPHASSPQNPRFDTLTIASIVFCVLPIAAAAQTGAGAAPANQGPMTVERVHGGFLAAPDFKVTELDKRTSELVGGYAGWLTDQTVFIGGGGYWLANQADDRKMAYGGVVLQWLVRSDRRIGFGAKGLIGGGQATLGTTVVQPRPLAVITAAPLNVMNPTDLNRVIPVQPTTTRVRFREGFFIAEPEVDLVVKLTSRLRLTGGVGYRLISAEGRDDNRLRGATGSVALQIGGGS